MLSIKEPGGKATGKIAHTIGGVMASPDKKDHAFLFTGTTDEAYVKVKRKWKLAVMPWTSQKTLMDGKPMGGPPTPPTKP